MKKKYKPESEDHKYFEGLLAERINDKYRDVDPSEWLYIHDGGPFQEQLAYMAFHWPEAQALVDVLEDSHLDDNFTPSKKYPVTHAIDLNTQRDMRIKKVGDPEALIHKDLLRSEVVARLAEIAHLDLGDDPDIWRRWFRAFDEDDFFPPLRI